MPPKYIDILYENSSFYRSYTCDFLEFYKVHHLKSAPRSIVWHYHLPNPVCYPWQHTPSYAAINNYSWYTLAANGVYWGLIVTYSNPFKMQYVKLYLLDRRDYAPGKSFNSVDVDEFKSVCHS